MTSFSPREIVSELDRFIVGQKDAKRAVAIALRNRWRRQQLPEGLKEEVLPKNILMIGPTGCGKTEISRRLAKLAGAPFLKVEATKFTEVGYVGRDVDSIVRDLVEVGIALVRETKRREVRAQAEKNAEERVLDALVGAEARSTTREDFRRRLRANEINEREVEVQVAESGMQLPTFDIPGGQVGMINLNEMLGKAFGQRTKPRRMTVGQAYEILLAQEGDKLIDQDQIVQEAIRSVENDGIVFLDEIDKILLARRERTHWRRRVARGRPARPVAATGRHHRVHQARAGEDRPRLIHRLGGFPHGQALGPAARAAGPAADPRRAQAAHQGGLPPHPG